MNLYDHEKNSCTKILTVLVLTIFFAVPLQANLVLSTSSGETLGGLSFEDGDLVDYDTSGDISTLFFNEDLFSNGEDIDAVHVLANGNIVLSTQGYATLGGLSFDDGDLIEYNTSTNTATMFLSESVFSGNEDIDAIFIRSNGNIVLSTGNSASIGNLNFDKDDLVEYNPTSQIASVQLSSTHIENNEDIDTVHILDDGDFLLSTESGATLGSLSFDDGDIIRYNLTTQVASLFLSESVFSNSADIDALTGIDGLANGVPEPATIALISLGGLLSCRYKK